MRRAAALLHRGAARLVPPARALSSEAPALRDMTKLVDSTLPMSDAARRVLALTNASASEQTRTRVKIAKEAFQHHEVDTGSSRVQGAPRAARGDGARAREHTQAGRGLTGADRACDARACAQWRS